LPTRGRDKAGGCNLLEGSEKTLAEVQDGSLKRKVASRDIKGDGMEFWEGLAIGIVVGVHFGVFIHSIMIMAKESNLYARYILQRQKYLYGADDGKNT